MLDQAMELLRRLIGILVAIFDIACTLIYYTYAIIIYSTGAVLFLLCWCAFCALTQSLTEHVPIKRWIDRRLQDKFLRKVKNMSYEELNMRARLINAGEDVKIRNEANSQILKEICDAENFSKYFSFSDMCRGLSVFLKMKFGTKPLVVQYCASAVTLLAHRITIADNVTVASKVRYYEPGFRNHRYDSKSSPAHSCAISGSTCKARQENYNCFPSLFKASFCDYQLWPQFTDNLSVLPVIPGMFIPPHPTPAAPSPFAIVRWWLSQDHESHRLECSIAGFATQLAQNRQRLRALDRESEDLKLELSQALEKKRRVRHRPTLPNYKHMYRNFDAAIETMRNVRHDLPVHQRTHVCSCPQEAAPSYPEWLVPRKRLRWYAFHPLPHPPIFTSERSN